MTVTLLLVLALLCAVAAFITGYAPGLRRYRAGLPVFLAVASAADALILRMDHLWYWRIGLVPVALFILAALCYLKRERITDLAIRASGMTRDKDQA